MCRPPRPPLSSSLFRVGFGLISTRTHPSPPCAGTRRLQPCPHHRLQPHRGRAPAAAAPGRRQHLLRRQLHRGAAGAGAGAGALWRGPADWASFAVERSIGNSWIWANQNDALGVALRGGTAVDRFCTRGVDRGSQSSPLLLSNTHTHACTHTLPYTHTQTHTHIHTHTHAHRPAGGNQGIRRAGSTL